MLLKTVLILQSLTVPLKITMLVLMEVLLIGMKVLIQVIYSILLSLIILQIVMVVPYSGVVMMVKYYIPTLLETMLVV